VQETAEHVQDVVHQVREQAQGTVDDTIQTVKDNIENIDFQQQVQQRPLLAVGAAFIGGIVLGKMTSGDHHTQHRESAYQGYAPKSDNDGAGITGGVRQAVQRSGLDETLSNAAAALMGSVTEQLKSSLNSSFPGFADKLASAQQTGGSFADKAQATQQGSGSGPTAASNAQ
jgi:regulator of protease activity HflC (stomatin/prohibitin superfamily)